MATICVKLKGVPRIIRVQAETMEDHPMGLELLAKDSQGKVVAKFRRNEITGWWPEDQGKTSLPPAMQSLINEVKRRRDERTQGHISTLKPM